MPNPLCRICGLPFHPRNAQQVVCEASACKKENRRRNDRASKQRRCRNCGLDVKRPAGRGLPPHLCPACQREQLQAKTKQISWMGMVECLKCGEKFASPDRRSIRLCQSCKNVQRAINAWQPSEVWG